MENITYELPDFRIQYEAGGELQIWHLQALKEFMRFILERDKLQIAKYQPEMQHDPFFLLAATGLGKTVAVPLHMYLKHCEDILAGIRLSRFPLRGLDIPRIWVVEPKIPIAREQAKFMNYLFQEFIKSRHNPHDPKHPVLFGCRTSVDNTFFTAPIKFVTTGIFSIYARTGRFKNGRDRIIIDEAHVTIEAEEGIELGIAICRNSDIPIDYMSATVDTTNLMQTLGITKIIQADQRAKGEKRYPIWMHNTGLPMEECIVDLVDKTLINPDPTSDYFPQGDDEETLEVLQAVLETGRAKGILIAINSFTGEFSDARIIADLLKSASYGNQLELLLLSGSIIRNEEEKERFTSQLKHIEQEYLKYAIIATSVVEMGVTFDTLDFVVTMDSGFEQVTIGETTLPQIVALPVNSLKQRIGRIGRRRPGIGYITNEVGAAYSSLSDEELNHGALQYEPIGLPMRTGTLTLLAYYSFAQEWSDPLLSLWNLNLPSKIHLYYERIERFINARLRLIDLGIAVGNKLTYEGKQCERWLGVIDLVYAMKIQQELSRSNLGGVLFYLVAASLNNVTLSKLSARDRDEASQIQKWDDAENPVDKRTRVRKGIILHKHPVEFTPQSELIGLYNIVSYFSNKYARMLFNQDSLPDFVISTYQEAYLHDCRRCGFDPKQIDSLLKTLTSNLRLFYEINRDRSKFTDMFGEVRRLQLSDIGFPELSEVNTWTYMEEIAQLHGRTRLILKSEGKGFRWEEINDKRKNKRSGMIYLNSTTLDMAEDQLISAKLIPLPGRGEVKAGEAWRIIHAQHEISK